WSVVEVGAALVDPRAGVSGDVGPVDRFGVDDFAGEDLVVVLVDDLRQSGRAGGRRGPVAQSDRDDVGQVGGGCGLLVRHAGSSLVSMLVSGGGRRGAARRSAARGSDGQAVSRSPGRGRCRLIVDSLSPSSRAAAATDV